MSFYDIIGAIISLIGVIILSIPSEKDSKQYPYFYLGALSAIAGAISSALAYVYMRRLGTRVHTATKPLGFGLFCALVCSIIIGITQPH